MLCVQYSTANLSKAIRIVFFCARTLQVSINYIVNIVYLKIRLNVDGIIPGRTETLYCSAYCGAERDLDNSVKATGIQH
jgi:hypothetical protein